MLQIENASIAYGNDILFSGFNLQLERGEIASISALRDAESRHC